MTGSESGRGERRLALADAISRARSARGLSVAEAAHLVEVSPDTIMRWETAASVPTGSRAQRLIEELNVDPESIFDARKTTYDRDIRPGSISRRVTTLESSIA